MLKFHSSEVTFSPCPAPSVCCTGVPWVPKVLQLAVPRTTLPVVALSAWVPANRNHARVSCCDCSPTRVTSGMQTKPWARSSPHWFCQLLDSAVLGQQLPSPCLTVQCFVSCHWVCLTFARSKSKAHCYESAWPLGCRRQVMLSACSMDAAKVCSAPKSTDTLHMKCIIQGFEALTRRSKVA